MDRMTTEALTADISNADDVQHDTYERVFDVMDEDRKGYVTKIDIQGVLRDQGISVRDRRVQETMEALRAYADRDPIGFDDFCRVVHPANLTLFLRAVRGDFVIPDFADFRKRLSRLFYECGELTDGEVATYIPQLARVDPDQYAMAMCTIDGQVARFGDWKESFCVQSTCKPVNYAIALERLGSDHVHKHVGREPSGQSFNELTLNKDRLPHNPMINAGAIMAASLIKPEEPIAERFDYITGIWRALAGGVKPGFDNAVYHSEKDNADRNFALAYFMRENGAFPENADIHQALDLYFQCCSLESDVVRMATLASTFASGGTCPLTHQRIFTPDTVKNALSLMLSCGMYDFSGEYAFTVGLPAKSGVSGALWIVVPNVCGIAIWSPRLDRQGNSVRGVAFSNKLVRHFNFHNYDSLVAHSDKYDPRGDSAALTSDTTYAANAAAATGDLNELKRLVASGLSINRADYDGRTPLHLAASEGRERVARFLLRRRADPTAQDRWGNRPWQDAEAHGYPDLAKLLKEACEDTGEDTLPAQTAAEATAHVPSAGSMAPLPSGVKDSDVVGVDEEGEPEAVDDLDEDAPPRTGTHG